MDVGIDRELRTELRSDERLLWSGKPWQGVGLSRADIFMIPFSVMWGGVAAFWEVTAIRQGPPLFALWGIPFVLLGLYLMIGRFFWDSYRRTRTFYGLSDQRILIINEALGRKVQSLSLTGLPQVALVVAKGRAGTLSFGTSNLPSWFAGWPGVASQLPPRFEGIENVREVQERIFRAQQDQR